MEASEIDVNDNYIIIWVSPQRCWVLMPSEKWRDGGVCLRLPIRHIRDVNGFLSEDIRLYWSLAPWYDAISMVTINTTLPWRRRLLPVATRRRLVSAEYFVCTLFKRFILCMFLKKIWNVE